MRYWKNIISFLFVIVFFVSCASQSEEIVPDYNNEFEQNTFDGLELTFAMSPYVCYEQDSLFGDIAKARVAEIEEKYDVDIVFDENESLVSNLFYSISSGIKPCDVMLSDSFELYNQMRANLLFPVDNMPEPLVYTNTEKWGGREKLITYAYDNHLYGVLPMYWPETIWKQVDHFFFVNENMITTLGHTDPREYVENGEWTRAKYEEVLNSYTHTNMSGDTVYALAAEPGHYFSIAVKTSGIDYIVKKEDGTYSNAFLEPGVIDKLTWVSDTFWNNWEVNITRGSDTFSTIAKFVNEESVMVLTHLYYGLADIQYTVDNFGILPFPLSDDLHGTGWIGQFEFYNNGISFPANIEALDEISTVVNDLFEPLPGYETEEARFEYYDRYIFHDSRDTKVIFECLENCRYLPYNDNGYLIPNAINNAKGGKSISQILEANAEIMQTTIDEVYIPLEETCDLLWGKD